MITDHERLLRNLGVLGSLKPNQRLLTVGREFFEIQCPSAWQPLSRYAMGESRRENLAAVSGCLRSGKQSITNAVTKLGEASALTLRDDNGGLVTRLLLLEEMQGCLRLSQALLDATEGLDNLAITYREDVACTIQIRELCVEVRSFVHAASRALGLTEKLTAADVAV